MSARTVMITGGGGGIGAALARQYAAKGCNLALLDIDEAGAQGVADACSQMGVEAQALCCDVTSQRSCEDAVSRTLQHFGRLDNVVANAGLTHLSLFGETELAVIRRVMEVNFFGAVNIAKASLPHLLEARGQYVAMSSVAGFCPLPMRTGYAASKYAVRGFFETLRTENRHHGLGVLIVCPSYVDTGIGDHALGGGGEKATHQRPEANQAISADDAAKKIVHAAEKRRDFLPVAKGARLAHLLSRLSPSWLERLSTRRVMHAGRTRGN
jgi:NAD(P)-dependent dehydrogenase (short-subunit alcohol dehydrogenase family)